MAAKKKQKRSPVKKQVKKALVQKNDSFLLLLSVAALALILAYFLL